MAEQEGTMEDLVRSIAKTNPFDLDRVSSPEDLHVDVAAIHARQFQRLKRYVQRASDSGRSSGVVIKGEAGVGKSHLLARLHDWTRRSDEVVSVPLHNLQASPQRMARYLLKASVSSLFYRRGKFGITGLFELLHHSVRGGQDLRRRLDLERVDEEVIAVLRGFLEGGDELGVGEAALAWLSGDVIDEGHAAALSDHGGAPVSTQLADDAAVERVLVVLAKLLRLSGKVLVIGLDQIDNLDPDQVHALAVFLHTLIDHTDNTVILTSGVKDTIEQFRADRVIPEAAWDRLAQQEIELSPLRSDEARQIVEARLSQFFGGFEGLSDVARLRREDPLFPLGAPWWDAELGAVAQVRPRDVIKRARDRWEDQQDALDERGPDGWLSGWQDTGASAPPPRDLETCIDEVVAAQLRERIAERQLEPNGLPPDADNLATLTDILLRACEGHDVYSLRGVERFAARPGQKLPTYDLVVDEASPDGRRVRTGVTFITSRDGRTVTAALRRIRNDEEPPDEVLLVTDERRPLKLAKVGRQHYEALQDRGPARFSHIKLPFDEVAHLDAMVGVLRQARVGDVEVEHPRGTWQVVDEPTAAAALHRLDDFRNQPLLAPLLTEEAGPPKPPPAVEPLPTGTVRLGIQAYLSWRIGAHAREVASKLAEDQSAETQLEAIADQVISVADAMHHEGALKSTPHPQGRFLLWLGGPR